MTENGPAGNPPFASVVLPVRNEADFVERCLHSIRENDYPSDRLEILVVDGMSDDGTRDILCRCAQQDRRIRIIDNPDRIVPTAMNLGITHARGEAVIRLDCHSDYAPDYIAKCLEVLTRTGADNVGGYITTRPGTDSAIGRAIAAATSSRFGVGGSAFRTGGGEREVDTVPFGCYRRDVFDRFGLYDERLVRNQDIELNSRIRRGGGKIVISPQIRLTYYNRSTFAGLRQQAFYNGLWNLYTVYVVGRGLRPRHFVPLAFVLSLLILAVAAVFYTPAWVRLAAELAIYAVVAIPFSISAARRASASALLTLVAFAQFHLAYGVGSLWGLLSAPLKFGRRKGRQPGRALADRRK